MSTPSDTISTDTSQRRPLVLNAAIRALLSGSSEVTISGRSMAIRSSRSAIRAAFSLSLATTSPPASL
jgi:hypothetical protein